MSNTTTSRSINALALGALFGLAAGILFAPKKGSESREQIKEEFHHAKASARKGYYDTTSKIANKAEDIKQSYRKGRGDAASSDAMDDEQLI